MAVQELFKWMRLVLTPFFFLQVCSLSVRAVDVVWTDAVNVGVVTNTVTKNAGGNAWNGGAASVTRFDGDGYLQVEATSTNTNRMFGLTYVNHDANYTTIGFAVYLRSNGNISVYEGGISRGNFGAYVNGDLFQVERSGGTITYQKNSVTFYTSTLTSSGPLIADCSINTNGGEVANAEMLGFALAAPTQITDLTAGWSATDAVTLDWTAPGNQGDAITQYDIEYGIGNFASTFNDDASPGATISGLTTGGNYQFRVVAINGQGSTTSTSATITGTVDVTWTDLVNTTASGNTLTKNAGGNSWNADAISIENFSGDGYIEWIATDAVTYRMCGLSMENTNASYTTIAFAIYTRNNGTLRIYEGGVNRGDFGSYTSGDRLRVQRTGTTLTYYRNGVLLYTSAVTTALPLMADCSIYSNGGSLKDVSIRGFTSGGPAQITDLFGGLTTPTEATLDWTAPANQGSTITGYRVEYGIGNFNSTYNDDASAGATISGLTAGGNYQFRVIAESAVGDSVASNTANLSGVVNITWTDFVGTSANGGTLTKISGGNGWNAGAASVNTFEGDGQLEFTAGQSNAYVMCGLSGVNADANYTTIGWAIYIRNNGTVRIYEGGVNRGDFGTYTAGDKFSVARSGTTITYQKNGVVFYTSTIASSGLLLADCSIYSTGAVILNAKLKGFNQGVPAQITDLVAGLGQPGEVLLTWSEPGNQGFPITAYVIEYGIGVFDQIYTDDAIPDATLTGLTVGQPYQFRIYAQNAFGDGPVSATVVLSGTVGVTWIDKVNTTDNGSTLTKTSGGNSWNAGGASANTFEGDGELHFTAAQANAYIMCGLSNENVDANYTSIRYAIYIRNNGTVRIYEGGINKGDFGTYTSGDIFTVARNGSTITYEKNGSVFYTSANASSGILRADCSIYTNGGKIVDTQINAFSAGPPSQITDLIAGWVAPGEVRLDWSEPGNQGFPITSYEIQYGIVSDGTFDLIFTDDDQTGALITGLDFNEVYQFRVVAINAYGAGVASNVAQLTGVVDIIWTDFVNTTANGSTVTKTSGGNSWNAGAASVNSFTGDGELEFRASQANTYRMCGLSSWNPDANYTSIGWAVYVRNNGTIRVYEGGINKGDFGSYTTGDLFAVNRTGSTITYKKNGVVFYTSANPSSGSVIADCSIYSNGGNIANARMTGFTAGPPGAVSDLTVDSGSVAGEYTLIWSAPANQGSPITAYQLEYGTVASGTFSAVVMDDATPGITVTGLLSTTYQFRVAAINILGTGPYSNIALSSLLTSDVVWTDLVNTTAVSNTLNKTSGGNSWNGGGASVNRFTNDGGVEFLANNSTMYRMCGLSITNASASYQTIAYALYMRNNGTLRIYENGVNRGNFGTYTAGDRFEVERVGQTISYRQNGNLLYTSGVASVGPLIVDAAIYSNTGSIADARLYYQLTIRDFLAVAHATESRIDISWTSPSVLEDPQYAGLLIRWDTTGFPATINDGTLLGDFTPAQNTAVHLDVQSEVTYYYSGFAYNTSAQYEYPVGASVTTPDLISPDAVTGLTATPGVESITLNWSLPDLGTYPNQDRVGIMIRRSTGSAPSDPADGEQVALLEDEQTTYTDTELDPQVTYYYSLFVYDEIPLYSDPTSVSEQPLENVDRLMLVPATQTGTYGTVTIPTQTAGVPLALKVVALDSASAPVNHVSGVQNVNFNATFINPASQNLAIQVNGQNVPGTLSLTFTGGISAPFTLSYLDAGIVGLGATMGENTPEEEDDYATLAPLQLTFAPVGLDVVLGIDAETSGHEVAARPFQVQVRAVASDGNNTDLSDNPVTPNYVSTVTLAPLLIQGITTGTLVPSSLSLGNGTGEGSMQYSHVGTIQIQATASNVLGGTAPVGESAEIAFTPNGFTWSIVSPPPDRTFYYLSEDFEASLSVLDFNAGVLPDYRGTVVLSGGANLELPAAYTYTTEDAGVHIFSLRGLEEETINLLAQDSLWADVQGGSDPLNIILATLDVESKTVPVGSTQIMVRILDANGEVIIEDNSTILNLRLTESINNQTATSPATQNAFQFTAGNALINLTDSEAEEVNVEGVSDPVLPSNTGIVEFTNETTTIGEGGIRIQFWREVRSDLE